MTVNPTYACENFAVAVRCLATGPGEIKTRLLSAFLAISPLTLHDIPDEVHEQFVQLRSLLAASQSHIDITKIRSKLRYMRRDKASQIAELFLNIYLQLTQLCTMQACSMQVCATQICMV